MSLARKIFSNTAWQVLGKAVTAVLGIVSIKLITNYLSTSTYGEYTTIYDYTALFAIIADFGLFTIAIREMAHDSDQAEKIVGNVLSVRTALAVAGLGLGAFAALLIPAYNGTHIPFGVLIVSVATVITLMTGTMSSVLQFRLRMQWVSIGLILGKIITVGYIAAAILYLFPGAPESGFPHLLYAWIIGGLVSLLITYAAACRHVNIAFRFDFAFWKSVLLKALPYGMALVLGTIYFRMGTITLSLFKMSEDAGRFGVPLRIMEILQIIPHYFMNSVLPVLTISLKSDAVRASRIFRYALDALAGLVLPMFVGGYVLAWPLISAVSGPQFLSSRGADGGFIPGSDVAFKIMLAGMIATYLHVALNYALVAMGRQIVLLRIYAVAALFNIILNLVLSPRFGFIGASVAAAVTEFLVLIMLFVEIRRVSIFGIWDRVFLSKTILCSFIMGLLLWILRDIVFELIHPASLALFMIICIGAAVFAVSMLMTRAISKEMIGLFRKN